MKCITMNSWRSTVLIYINVDVSCLSGQVGDVVQVSMGYVR